MITVNTKFHIPNQWEELSPSQFCNVGKALRLLDEGKVDFGGFKLLVLYYLMELEPQNDTQGNNTYCENLFRISEHITFPYKFVYPDERFLNFPPDTQQWLAKHLPTDLQDPYLRIAASMGRYVEPDLHFAKQMVPVLPGSKLQGYTFTVIGQVANTNLTAGQYIDANTMLQQYHSTHNIAFLEQLVKILYCQPYNAEKAEKLSLKKVAEDTLYAVMYNYMAIVNWISALPKYDILFHSPSKRDGKNPLGPNAPLYTLSGKGYGSLKDMGAMPLFSYLDLLLKQTVDAVLQLKSIGKKKGEIASELNLTIEQINTIL